MENDFYFENVTFFYAKLESNVCPSVYMIQGIMCDIIFMLLYNAIVVSQVIRPSVGLTRGSDKPVGRKNLRVNCM